MRSQPPGNKITSKLAVVQDTDTRYLFYKQDFYKKTKLISTDKSTVLANI